MTDSEPAPEYLSKPVLVYDGACGFCKTWVARFQGMLGEAVDYRPYQEVPDPYFGIPHSRFQQAVHLIRNDGNASSGAEAAFETLAILPENRWMLSAYRKIPGIAPLTEKGYQWVADHRPFLDKVDGWVFGHSQSLPSYRLSAWFFLRLLALIYFVAFISLGVQIPGLIGSHGIIPAADFLERVETAMPSAAPAERFWQAPTLFLWGSSDTALGWGWKIGAMLSIVMALGVATPLMGLLLWLLYLSYVTVGGAFLGFQWDNLLLEAGLIGIFLAPFRWLPHKPGTWSPPKLVLILFALLLFRLNVSSGVVKLQTEDPTSPNTWQELTALDFHYQTQPLPTVFAWYAHQLPEMFQKFSVVMMFVIQLAVPFLVFFPARFKRFAALGMGTLQVLILITGNYCFFNLLALGFCLLLVDDEILRRVVPKRLIGDPFQAPVQGLWRWTCKTCLVLGAAVVLGGGGLIMFARTVRGSIDLPGPIQTAVEAVYPFRSINTYGLFAHMTTERLEITVQGSRDGKDWEDYVFRYKPGPLDRAPAWVAPHQPRLDWQMWFAALGSYQRNPWFVSFMHHLLLGTPEVTALLETNPFTDKPPEWIRATIQDYRFTNFEEKSETGDWWAEEGEVRLYFPEVRLEDFRKG